MSAWMDDNEDDLIIQDEDEFVAIEQDLPAEKKKSVRRRLEDLLEDKQLDSELDDYYDF